MPIAYLDVPAGADAATKRDLVTGLYAALSEAWPFPDDTRIFLREWPQDAMSQNGVVGATPAQPVFTMHIPKDADRDVVRTTLRKIDAAVTGAYHLPELVIFLHEHSLDTVAVNGNLLADDAQRVEEQGNFYPKN